MGDGRCLACDYPFDAHGELGTGVDWDRPPAGSMCMCLACGCLMIVTGDGDMIRPNDLDFAQWRKNPTVVQAIVERAFIVSKRGGLTNKPV